MKYSYAEMLVKRLFSIITIFAYTESDVRKEVEFLRVMCRKHPNVDWNNVMSQIRYFKS